MKQNATDLDVKNTMMTQQCEKKTNITFNSLDDMLFKNRAAKKKRIRLSWNNFDQV